MALTSGARRAVHELAGWGLAVAALAASVLYFSDIRQLTRDILGIAEPAQVAQTRRDPPPAEPPRRASAGRSVEIRAGTHGHFFAHVELNGRSVEVLVDSGASIVALTSDDARRAGIYVRDADYTHRVSTANGVARIAPVTIDRIAIGDILVRNVEAAVAEPGKLEHTLLGMSFLKKLGRVEMRNGLLVLEE